MAPPAPARKMLEPKPEPLPPPLTPPLGVTVLRLTVSEPRKRQAATRLPEDRATHTGTSVTRRCRRRSRRFRALQRRRGRGKPPYPTITAVAAHAATTKRPTGAGVLVSPSHRERAAKDTSCGGGRPTLGRNCIPPGLLGAARLCGGPCRCSNL